MHKEYAMGVCKGNKFQVEKRPYVRFICRHWRKSSVRKKLGLPEKGDIVNFLRGEFSY